MPLSPNPSPRAKCSCRMWPPKPEGDGRVIRNTKPPLLGYTNPLPPLFSHRPISLSERGMHLSAPPRAETGISAAATAGAAAALDVRQWVPTRATTLRTSLSRLKRKRARFISDPADPPLDVVAISLLSTPPCLHELPPVCMNL